MPFAAESGIPEFLCAIAQPLMTALVKDPMTGIVISNLQGQILFANTQAARIFVGQNASANQYMGKSVHDVLPKPVADLRLQLYETVSREKRPMVLRSIWLGRQLITRIQPLSPEPMVLITSRYMPGPIEERNILGEGETLVTSPYVNLGALDALSDRELEVLALLATGMTAKEIATKLDRSFKTVENHRYVIGRRLGIEDRHSLEKLAFQAGLTAEDSTRTRV